MSITFSSNLVERVDLSDSRVALLWAGLQSTLSETDTLGTCSMCPSLRDVRLTESQMKGVKKGRDQL